MDWTVIAKTHRATKNGKSHRHYLRDYRYLNDMDSFKISFIESNLEPADK